MRPRSAHVEPTSWPGPGPAKAGSGLVSQAVASTGSTELPPGLVGSWLA